MLDLGEFRLGLLNDVETRAELDREFALPSFVGEASQRLAEAEAVENLEALHFRGTGRRNRNLGVDGFDLDDADGSITLAIAKFSGSSAETPAINQTEAKKLLGALESFLEEAVSGEFLNDREPSARDYALAVDLRNRGRSPSRYRLLLLTDHLLSDRVKEFPSSDLDGIPVDYQIWDIRRFYEVEQSARGREELTIDLREWLPNGLPSLRVVGEGGFTTYLAAVPGAMLADLYLRYGSRLLESNVRSYLSARGKINKGIQVTVQSEPDMFLAYNNGITATATGVVSDDRDSIISITDLQIVNGGQTTASLFYVRRDGRGLRTSLDGVHVQMKLVVVDLVRAGEVVPNISRYANSQNRVSEADFFSNSPFHIRLEELSRRILAPQLPGHHYQTRWYYERTRGQYQNDRSKLGTAEQRRFDLIFPRNQVITKTDAARYEVAWAQEPHQVSAGAQKNFMAFAQSVAKRWEESPNDFNEQYFRSLVSKAILYQTVRQAVTKQDWYQQGYLANITAYTLAKLSYEIERQARGSLMNFKLIWDRQAVPDPVLSQCLTIAEEALLTLTAPTREVQNVTEWAKRRQAWDTFKAVPVLLTTEFKHTLLSSHVANEIRSNARAQQKIDSGIQQQAAVLSIPPEEWQNLWDFTQEHKMGTSAQRGILDKLRRQQLVPSERQVKAILDLLTVAKARGYTPLQR